MRRVVVVGAGLAGLRAAQELRENGFEGSLTIVGDEVHPPYNRPPLSKQVLAGEQSPQECYFPLGDLDVQWMLGRPAVGLDPGGRAVQLAGGVRLEYDGLVLATGRRARDWPDRGWPDRPPFKGFHTLRGLDDAIALRAAIADAPPVVIVGAGFVGCEVAASLRKLGLPQVHLVDVAPWPMSALGAQMGRRAEILHRENGVQLHLGRSVVAFVGDGGGSDGAGGALAAVRLDDGSVLPARVVVLALGSLPNTEWLAGSGLTLDSGDIVCDAQCFAVGRRDVVAAGDVAVWPHSGVGSQVRVEHWTNANDMARLAARNLLDPAAAQDYRPVPTFWTDQYDAKIKAVGLWRLVRDLTVVSQDDDRGSLVAEGSGDDGELVGALTMNHAKGFIDYRRRLAARYSA